MAGILGAERILPDSEKIVQKIEAIGKAAGGVADEFERIAKAGDTLSKSLGGSDSLNKIIKASNEASKATEELTFNQAELAKQAQELGKLTAKLEEIESHYNKEIQKTKEAIKQKNAAIKEEVNSTKKLSESLDEINIRYKKLESASKTMANGFKIPNSAIGNTIARLQELKDKIDVINQIRVETGGGSNEGLSLQLKSANKEAENLMASLNRLESIESKLNKGTVDFQSHIKGLTQKPIELEQMASYYSELEKQSDKALESSKDLEKQRSKSFVSANNKAEAQAQREAAQATKLAAQEEKLKIAVEAQAVGSIKRLQAENALNAFTIKNKLNPAIESERAEILRLNQVIGVNKDSIAKMHREQVTSWGRVTQAVWQHLAAYVGFQQLIQIAKNIFNTTKELDSLNYAITSVITNQADLAESQQFISRITESYGAELITTTNRYIKFYAAAKQSKTSLKDTQKIFESVTKVSATLGLKTDELTGIYLALEQMMSKGTVTTEELRRQLGERVPGAVAIMARSIGVSTAKLSEMMKKGQVLASEVLPKFAEELERSFGVENINRIDTMQTATARLALSWQEFVKQMEGGKMFTGILNAITNSVNGYVQAMEDSFESYARQDGHLKTATKNVDKLISTYERLSIKASLTKDEQEELTSVTASLSASFGGVSGVITKFDAYGNALKIDTGLIHAVITETRGMNAEMKKSVIEDETRKLEGYNKKYERLQEMLKTGKNDGVSITEGTIAGLPAKIKELGTIIKDTEGRIKILRGEIAKPVEDVVPFDIEKFEKEIDSAKDTYIDFAKAIKGGADAKEQNELISRSKILKAGFKTEKDYLNSLLVEYKDNVDARLIIRNRLGEIEKKEEPAEKRAGKTKLKLQEEANEQSLAEFKRNEQLTLAEQALASNELIDNDEALKAALEEQKYESDQRIIAEEIRLQEELLKLTKEGSTERASIESEITKLKEDKAKGDTDRVVDLTKDEIDARKKAKAQELKDAELASRQLLSNVENDIVIEQTARVKKAGEDIKNAKGNAVKTKEIRDNLAEDLLNIELKHRKKVEKNDILINEDRQRNSDRIVDVEKDNEERKLKVADETADARQERQQQIFDRSVELLNAGFDFAKQIYSNELSVVEQTYKRETEAAGDNLEEKTLAERKYQAEVAKIKKKQAITDKAQAAMNIAFSTAQALIAVWGSIALIPVAPVLTALISGIGALQLATVLATPIPEFFTGTDDAPATFIAGDDPYGTGASEMIIKPTGEMILTPNKPTLFSDKSFIGSTILPHDKTQEMLNSYAINGGSQVFVDMSGSEKYLNQIANNTKNNSMSGIDSRGRQFIKRGNTITTLCN